MVECAENERLDRLNNVFATLDSSEDTTKTKIGSHVLIDGTLSEETKQLLSQSNCVKSLKVSIDVFLKENLVCFANHPVEMVTIASEGQAPLCFGICLSWSQSLKILSLKDVIVPAEISQLQNLVSFRGRQIRNRKQMISFLPKSVRHVILEGHEGRFPPDTKDLISEDEIRSLLALDLECLSVCHVESDGVPLLTYELCPNLKFLILSNLDSSEKFEFLSRISELKLEVLMVSMYRHFSVHMDPDFSKVIINSDTLRVLNTPSLIQRFQVNDAPHLFFENQKLLPEKRGSWVPEFLNIYKEHSTSTGENLEFFGLDWRRQMFDLPRGWFVAWSTLLFECDVVKRLVESGKEKEKTAYFVHHNEYL